MRTTEKVDAMVEYFRAAGGKSRSLAEPALRSVSDVGLGMTETIDPKDAAWAVYFLSGGRPKRLIPVRRLATWAMEEAKIPEWLFSESYEAVGDLAETMSLLLPDA